MKKIFFFSFIFLLNTIATLGQSDKGYSVNAYYDAIQLSRLSRVQDAESSNKILSILARYNRQYNFKSTEIIDIYTNAVKRSFSLDILFKYFDKPKGISAATQSLSRLIEDYKDLNNKLAKLADTIKTFNEQYQLIKLLLSDSIALQQPVNRQKAKDSLVNYFMQFFDIKRRSENGKIADSILQNPAFAMQLADTAVYQQNRIYTSRSDNWSKDMASQPDKIQNFFVSNFDKLDKDLKAKFGSYSATGKLPDLNKNVIQSSFQSNNLSDELYRKNETASLTNFKLPTQTEVIDALAIYLAKRFKQEVALTLVDQFRKTLKNDQLLNDLFPETYKMFKSGELFEMPSFGSAWNYAISKDFTNMLVNLSTSVVIKEKIGDSILVTYLQNIIKLSSLINKQYSYVDAVSQIYHQEKSTSFFAKSIRSLYIINQELFDTANASQFWINPEGLYALYGKQLTLFYALLKEKYNNDLGLINANDLNNPDVQPRVRNMMSSLLVLLNNFQNNRRVLMNTPGSKVQSSGYWDFLMSLFETLQTEAATETSPYLKRFTSITNLCFETYSMLSEKNYSGAALKLMDLLPELRDYHYVDMEAICFSGNRLQKLVGSSSYNEYRPVQEQINNLDKLIKSYLFIRDLKREVMLNSADYRYLLTDQRIAKIAQKNANLKKDFKSNLLDQLTKDSISLRTDIHNSSVALQNQVTSKKLTWMQEIPVTFITNKILDGTPEATLYIRQSGSSQFETIRKVTSFLSDMVLAGNSKNLSQVIEKYALPPNSYKIKRHTRSSWDVNAYVGAYLGGEILTSGNSSVSPVYGFSVPIGVSYSWGKTKIPVKGSDETIFNTKKGERVLKGNSITVNLSLVDIGAVVSYRLTNDASKGLPQQVKWSQLISPGLHLRWGIKETAICVSAGIQSTPQLRKLNITSEPVNAIRFYTGLFMDIPLVNITYR